MLDKTYAKEILLTPELHGRLKDRSDEEGVTMCETIERLLDGDFVERGSGKKNLRYAPDLTEEEFAEPFSRPPFWAPRLAKRELLSTGQNGAMGWLRINREKAIVPAALRASHGWAVLRSLVSKGLIEIDDRTEKITITELGEKSE